MALRRPTSTSCARFCVAADLGTLGRAAVRLHVSQPSLSKRLASLEAKVGARLLERSPRGVTLTPAGRRLYRHARPLLEAADQVGEVMAGIRHTGAVVRLAASHSASRGVRGRDARQPATRARSSAVELVNANSQVVRALVADGRADVGVAASRPGHTPNPGVRESELVDRRRDRLRGPARPRVGRARHGRPPRFLATPMVVRDPSSNARWTVDAVLGARAAGRRAAGGGGDAARRARRRRAPRRARAAEPPHHRPDRLRRRSRSRAAVPAQLRARAPAYGEPTGEVRELDRGDPRVRQDLAALARGLRVLDRAPEARELVFCQADPRAARRGGAPRSGRGRAAVRPSACAASTPPPSRWGGRRPRRRILAWSSRTRAVASRQSTSVCGRAGRMSSLLDLEVPSSARIPERLQMGDGGIEVRRVCARRSRSAASRAW